MTKRLLSGVLACVVSLALVITPAFGAPMLVDKGTVASLETEQFVNDESVEGPSTGVEEERAPSEAVDPVAPAPEVDPGQLVDPSLSGDVLSGEAQQGDEPLDGGTVEPSQDLVDAGKADTRLDMLASAEIEDGVYHLQAASDPKAFVGVAHTSAVSGENVALYGANGTLGQKWRIQKGSDGYYTLTALCSGMVLDVADGGTTPGTNVWQCTAFGNDAQKWSILVNEEGTYNFISKLNGLALSMVPGTTAPGTNIQVDTASGALSQSFALTPYVEPVPEAVLEEGIYEIASAVNTDFALDVAGASRVSGANVQLYAANKTLAQKWRVKLGADGYYTIESLGSGKVLDVADGGVAPGTNVWQCTPFGNDAQKWRAQLNDNGSISLYSKASGLALDVADALMASGTNIQTYSPNTSAAQQFVFTRSMPLSDGLYSFAAGTDDSLLLDVAGASGGAGANVQMHSSNGHVAQKWLVTCDDEGFYTMESLCSGKVLEVADGGSAPGTNVQQNVSNASDAQKWAIEPASGGNFNLVSKLSGLALDMQGGRPYNDVNVQVYTANKTDGQLFRPYRVDPLVDGGVYTVGAFANPQMKLDVMDASRASGANIQLFTANGGRAQVFQVSRDAEGYYTFTLPFSKKVLDVANGSSEPGANVWQCTAFGNDAQKWSVRYAGDGSFTLISKLSGLALDLANGSSTPGTNVQVYTPNGTPGQRFVFEPTVYIPEDFTDRMSIFSTLSTNSYNGWFNMSKALSAFDGVVIHPGQTISFFGVAGPCGAAQGYLPAGVVGGVGYGGGICQASTTLYGTAIRAGLTVVERRPHSVPSTYVPWGVDAMVNFGSSDLRLRNDFDFPIKIAVSTENRTLTASMYGIQPEWFDSIAISSWQTGWNSASASRTYYKNGGAVMTEALPNSYYY